ncbi:glutathione S-transferase-like protein [Polychaeton citri CBS 116435]|uniref:Glutathione S-transferase-like protein n=1 Tax=Polychaeton citri CBS 116435 TaxID=1314669 RepID=A0A9P4Q203_9PEZI|nr:glutathione S-transferase-like protein [Polychaeton citri CBS 116435]
MQELVLHEDPFSGNCYKIRLTASLVGANISTVSYNLAAGETRTARFCSTIDANGRVPVLQIGSETFLPESNAACYYLATGTSLVPEHDRLRHANMLRWMFFEQSFIEPTIGTLRFWYKRIGKHDMREEDIAMVPNRRKLAEDSLETMNIHLGGTKFFGGETPDLADVVLFAYTHVAEDAELDLNCWMNVKAWCQRLMDEKYCSPLHI